MSADLRRLIYLRFRVGIEIQMILTPVRVGAVNMMLEFLRTTETLALLVVTPTVNIIDSTSKIKVSSNSLENCD